jgi:dihydrofolate reductase
MTSRAWTGLVFIGTSVDGMIARTDGSVDWLTSRGEAAGDAGYTEFSARTDTVLMGRGTYDMARSFPAWPFISRRVLVLSTSLAGNDDDRITVVRDLAEARARLDELGARAVNIDGGQTIRSCLAAGLVDELTISHVTVLIGNGLPLFGALPADIDLTHLSTTVLGGGMVQTTYAVNR